MEETTTTYIPFGESGQIELNPLMETLANNVNSYVESKPWSRKKKERFMNAYSSLMSRGIVGASIKNGLWYIDYNGDPLEGIDSRDKDMYEQAAYFIKSLMLDLVKSAEKEEEKDLPLFGNKYFTDLFEKHLLNNEFGGRPISTQENWNTLDERDSKTGLRGITNRANILAKNLESFSKSLEDGKYDFKDSPYRDLDDVRERISNAIAALRTPDPSDDKAALNKLGIDYNKWFYDGGDDTVTIDGQLMTARDYYGIYKPELEKAKEEQEAEQLKLKQALEAAKLAQLRQELFSSLKFYSPKNLSGSFADLQRKYADEDLGKLFSSLASKQLNSEQYNDLATLFREVERSGLLSELSDKEKLKFGRFSNLTGRLRKINGIEGFYWDTAAKRIVLPSKINGQSILTNDSNSMLLMPTLEKQRNSPRGGGLGLTNADKVDIGATIADIAAIIDPEIISGTLLALGASGARGTNRDWQNNFWGSLGHQAFDTGTALLGGLPLLGDAVTGAKVIKSLANVLKIGAVASAVSSVPEAAVAAKKVAKGDYKLLTPEDFRALANVLIGIYTGKTHVSHNLRERKVLEKSGYETRNDFRSRYGLRSSKVTQTTPTVKAKVNGKEQEIEISEKVRDDIDAALKEAGTDVKARNDKVSEILKREKLVGDDATVTVEAPRTLFGDRTPKWISKRTTNTSKGVLGETSSKLAPRTGTDSFESYLLNRSRWSRFSSGTNPELRRIRKNLGIPAPLRTYTLPAIRDRRYVTPDLNTPNPKDFGLPEGTSIQKYINNALGANPKVTKKAAKYAVKKELEVSEKINLSDKEFLDINITKDGKLSIKDSSGNILLKDHAIDLKNYSFDIKELVAKVVREQRYNLVKEGKIRPISKELIQSLKEMKRKGILYLYGGKLTSRLILENFYKTL